MRILPSVGMLCSTFMFTLRVVITPTVGSSGIKDTKDNSITNNNLITTFANRSRLRLHCEDIGIGVFNKSISVAPIFLVTPKGKCTSVYSICWVGDAHYCESETC